MTTPADPTRPTSPMVREIAALTARLRDLSGRGRDVEPAERAAFLADKDVLIARITDTATDTAVGADGREGARVDYGEAARAEVRPALSLDDPVVVAERAGQERAEHGPSRTEETLTHADAADRLTELGFDGESARAMVAAYLHETSRTVGAPVYQWGLDHTDVDAIAADYRWVDHPRGETLAQARDRAAQHAAGWTGRATSVDREHSPGYASRVDQQAARWAQRAAVPEPFTHPGPADAHDDVERDEQRREQLTRWHHDDHGDYPEQELADGYASSVGGGDADGQVWVCDDAPGLP